MALDDFFKRQREEQEQKREAQRILFEKQQKEREEKDAFEKKLPDFFKEVVDPAVQRVIDRFREERLDGIYAGIGRKFRGAKATQRILHSRDFYVDFKRNGVQFQIFARTDSFRISVEVMTNPKDEEFKTVDVTKDYSLEKFTTEVLLRMVGTALENMETILNGESGVIQL